MPKGENREMISEIKNKAKKLFPNLIGLCFLQKQKRNTYIKICEPLGLDQSEYPAYLQRFYKERTGHPLNLDNPQRYTEKIQWRKLYDRDSIYTLLSDKYTVREWVKNKIGEEYLIPLLGKWDHFDQIEFDQLPDRFVLKTNNGCHSNIIVKDKNQFLRQRWIAKKKMEYWMTSQACYEGLELHYKDIQPLIIAEEFMEPESGEDCLTDYKIHCFNGTPFVFEVIEGRTTRETVDLYDTNWKHLPVTELPFPNSDQERNKPGNLEKMLEIASELSKGFQYVRVDLYSTDKVYFGEMTFTPTNGLDRYAPDEWDYVMSEKWDIHTEQVDHTIVTAFQ